MFQYTDFPLIYEHSMQELALSAQISNIRYEIDFVSQSEHELKKSLKRGNKKFFV